MYISLLRNVTAVSSSPIIKLHRRTGEERSVSVSIRWNGTCTAGVVKLYAVARGYDASGAVAADYITELHSENFSAQGTTNLHFTGAFYAIKAAVTTEVTGTGASVSVDVLV